MLYTYIKAQEKPGGVLIKKCNMRKSLFIILTFFPVVNVLSQNTYVYEMSMNSYNIGYYYIEYSENISSPSDTLVVHFYDKSKPCINLHVNFAVKRDTISAVTDMTGSVYLDCKKITRDDILTVMVKPMHQTIGYLEMPVYFWEWREQKRPVKINVFVEHKYNSIVHIRSRKPLSLQEMDKIKQAVQNNNLSEIEKDDIEISVIEHI